MKKSKIITIVAFVLFYAAIIFFAAPNLNPLYSDGLVFWGIVIASIVIAIFAYGGASKLSGSYIKGTFFSFKKSNLILIIVAVAPWIILVAVNIFSIPFFHPSRYRDQMPQPESRKFTSDLQPLDVSQLPIVDADLAYKLADKKLGEKPALGSQVTLGTPTIQRVNGKLVWVVPLEHSGFFKWLSSMSGTPGYIVVSATDPRDVSYKENYKIKYQPRAYLFDKLERHARLDGGLFTGLTDYSFELDDTGRPYWVVTTYKNLLGFSMPEATGALIIDAQTGKTRRYSISNMPDWVDRVQPQSFIMRQLNNRGEYIHGVWNFSNKDKFETSDGSIIVYNNGRCYLFTGITSVGEDESAVGFVMVDMVTKKPYLYEIGGATEYAAQKSAEGKVQHLKYTASYPIITNVNGEPTYCMTLKDNAGLIKQYAFVSVKDYTTVGTGETITAALDDFNHKIRENSSGNLEETKSLKQTVKGTISRFAAESQNGSTVYKFTLTEKSGLLFTAAYDVSNQLALTKEGDKVSFTCEKESENIYKVSSFTNETLSSGTPSK
ncbi:hypothetical protein CCDG5_1879 [[Clostridium] cellulosi]|jgi:hypothetical protein|uniref:Cell shape-determining protein n=1 Tax=[Clostridium] cellulosi TaxID=29343 RepID=A0A078KUW9_9FIRM|nr:hypothetical protein CCDG5_1879 [[Clostridium] cellulosi]